jgi:hypothetical protein
LQGVNRTALAVMIMLHHRAALLSCSSVSKKLAQPANFCNLLALLTAKGETERQQGVRRPTP